MSDRRGPIVDTMSRARGDGPEPGSAEMGGSPLRALVVDLDSALLRTDLYQESFFQLLSAEPLKALRAIGAAKDGSSALKARLADAAPLAPKDLPLNEALLHHLREEKEKGRPIYLACTADQRHADALAHQFGLFSGAVGSPDGAPLDPHTKAQVLTARFGQGGFDYIGDASGDDPINRSAAFVHNVSDALRGSSGTSGTSAEDPSRLRHYMRALRPHQWLKNVLVFVPAIAAHELGWPLLQSVIAFVSFSLCASSVYILNDLLDLRSDRAHPRKKLRPFAAGRIPLAGGAALVPILLACALALALFLPPAFLAALGGYYALTCAYSFNLKRRLLVDVVTLACLYGARLLAGAAATQVMLSPWLIAFAIFLFLSLALVKRCSELTARKEAGAGDPVGRAYRLDDLPILQMMSMASGYMAVLVLALYVNSPDVRVLYAEPSWLWLLCVLLLYWISRVGIFTHRGKMHDDPVIFAVTDHVSQLVAVAGALVVFASM